MSQESVHTWPWVKAVEASGTPVPELEGHRYLSIRARGSGQNGGSAVRAVHDDAVGAVDEFRRRYRLDLSHLLLSIEEITARQKEAPVHRSERGDKLPLLHSFVVADHRASDGVYLEYILGTGALVDEDFRQPALAQAAEMFDRIRPSAMWTKDLLRQGRHPWELGPLLQRVQIHGTLFGDEKSGLETIRPGSEVLYFMRMLQGQAEAQQFFDRSRRGMAQHVGTRTADGLVDVSAMSPLPPGLVRLRMRSVGEGRNPSVLTFDSPGLLPPERDVVHGYPSLRDSSGELVDQVANVRWAIIELARNKMTLREIGEELGRRQFSTTGLRQLRGRDRTYADAAQPADAARTIQTHLEFYRSGSFDVHFGHPGHEDTTITGLIPPGGWAPVADIDQAIAHRNQRRDKKSQRRLGTFSGLRLVVNGQPSRLSLVSEADPAAPEFRYRLYRPGNKALGLGLTLTHSFLAKLIVDAVASAGSSARTIVPAQRMRSSPIGARLRTAETRAASLQAQLVDLRAQLASRLPSGEPAITGALLQDLNANYNDCAGALTETRKEIEALERESIEADHQWRSDNASIVTSELLEMVASLRDPSDQRFAERWRACLNPVVIDVERRTVCNRVGLVVDLHAALKVAGDPGTIQIAADVHIDTAEIDAAQRAEASLDAMRAGVPFPLQRAPQRVWLKTQVLRALGLDRREGAIVSCSDGRIVRTALAIRDCPTADDVAIAGSVGETVEFVRRIREVWGTSVSRHAWVRRPRAPLRGALLALHSLGGSAEARDLPEAVARRLTSAGSEASRRRLLITRCGTRFEVEPCANCGRTAFATATITEIDSAVCLGCAKDRSGVDWPLGRYQRVLHDFDRWIESALIKPVPLDEDAVDPFMPSPPALGRGGGPHIERILGVTAAEVARFSDPASADHQDATLDVG